MLVGDMAGQLAMIENYSRIVFYEVLFEIVAVKWISALRNAVIMKDSKLYISEMIFSEGEFKRMPLTTIQLEEINMQINFSILNINNPL